MHSVINIQHTQWGLLVGPDCKKRPKRLLPATGILVCQAQCCMWAWLPQPGSDVEQPISSLMHKYDVSVETMTMLPEQDRDVAIGNMQKNW